MVKYNDRWGTVCDDSWTDTNSQAACQTLGWRGGSHTNYDTKLSEVFVPIWMDNVKCSSSSTNFLQCSHPGWGEENCSHAEDILLTCT